MADSHPLQPLPQPLLAQNRESANRWIAFVVPILMALVGMFLATASACSGQAAARRDGVNDILTMRKKAASELRIRKELNAPEDRPRDEFLTRLSQRPLDDPEVLRPFRMQGRALTQWDGEHYEEIIDQGYVYHMPGDSQEIKDSHAMPRAGGGEPRTKNVVWYPLYPILGYLVKSVSGLPTHHALTVVAWACLLAASVVIFNVIRRQLGAALAAHRGADGGGAEEIQRDTSLADFGALYALAFLLYGPAAIFLYANYTESLFLLLLGLFVMALQKRHWWAAAAIAAVASASRSQGVFFGPMLAVIYLIREDSVPIGKRLLIATGLGAVSAIGITCYILYLSQKFHAPLAFIQLQKHWHVGLNKDTIVYAINPLHAFANFWDFAATRPAHGKIPDWPRTWEAFCVIAPPIILLLGRRLLSLEWRIIGWVFWALPYFSQSLGASRGDAPDPSDNALHWMSMGRFMAVVLPLHIIIGTWTARSRWLGPMLIAASAVLFALLAYTFGMRGWVG